MGGSSGGGDTTNTIRYAPYVESKHESFLNTSKTYGDLLRGDSPYDGYTELDFDAAFYGSGYTISSFPSMYDMFGKFMAGLDIEALFEQVLYDVQNTTTIQEASKAHRDLLDDDIAQSVLPRFQEGMRDINAVMSSSFVVGQSIIEQGRVKKLAEFDADLRYKLIPIAADVFSKHLAWNQNVISSYLEIIKTVINTELNVDGRNYEMLAKNKIWPFTIMEQERANLGALQGATTAKQEKDDSGGTLGTILAGIGLAGSLLL